MKVRDHYDWIVLGSHPGALLSATLAARLGMSVLILPFGPVMSARFSESRQLFDPEPNYVLGLGDDLAAGPGRAVLDGSESLGLLSQCLDLTPEEFQKTAHFKVTQKSFPQVLTPSTRMVLGSTHSLLTELQRELGSDFSNRLGLAEVLKDFAPEFASFWNQLPGRLSGEQQKKNPQPYQFFAWKALEELRKKISLQSQAKLSAGGLSWFSDRHFISHLGDLLGSPDFLEISAGLRFGVVATPGIDSSLYDFMHMLSLSRGGGQYRGGLSAYRQFLIQRAVALGAHFSSKFQLKRIFIEQSQFGGVQISGAANMISGGVGILGCSLSRVEQAVIQGYPRWSFNWAAPWRSQRKTLQPPLGWRMTLALTVHREVIPEKMQARAVWQEKGAPPLEVEVAELEDYGTPDSDRCVVFLRALMPWTFESLEVEYQRRIAGRMFKQAAEIFPFLEFHVTRLYPDFRSGTSMVRKLVYSDTTAPEASLPVETELSRLYGFPTLEAIPDNLLVFGGSGIGHLTGIENLFAASEESYPEWGSLGGVVAALESITCVAHRSGMTGPFPERR